MLNHSDDEEKCDDQDSSDDDVNPVKLFTNSDNNNDEEEGEDGHLMCAKGCFDLSSGQEIVIAVVVLRSIAMQFPDKTRQCLFQSRLRLGNA